MTSTDTTPATTAHVTARAFCGDVVLETRGGDTTTLYLDEAHALVDALQAAIRNAHEQQAAMDRQRQAEVDAADWAEGVQKEWAEGRREIAANLEDTGVFVLVEVDEDGSRWDAVAFDGDHFRYEYPAAPDLRRLQSWLARILQGSRSR